MCQLGWATVPRYLIKHCSVCFYRDAFGREEHLIWWTLRKADYSPHRGWASFNQLKAFIEQRLTSQEQQEILPAAPAFVPGLQLPWVSSLPAHPADCGLSSFQNYVSQILMQFSLSLSIYLNLFIYTHIYFIHYMLYMYNICVYTQGPAQITPFFMTKSLITKS